MAKFDLIGLGNALVDSEFHVTDSFLKKKALKIQISLGFL